MSTTPTSSTSPRFPRSPTSPRSPRGEPSASLTPPQRSKYVVRILEDSGALMDTKHVTAREVDSLRVAFDRAAFGISPLTYSGQMQQCDNVLWQLEKRVAADVHATTGDEDRDMSGGDNWKFAKIPPRRRFQTFMVTVFNFFAGMPFFLFLSLYMTFCNFFTMPFMVCYWIYIFTIGKPRHPIKRNKWFSRHAAWKHFGDYFPIRLVVPKKVRKLVDTKKNYIFCYHPHGVHSFGAIIAFGSDALGFEDDIFPGLKMHVQSLPLNFNIPFWREFMIGSGTGDASPSSIRRTLRAGPGESVMLVVGGAEESLMSSPKTNDLTLSKRKGFVKLALEAGSPLVPTFGFGETNCYGNHADGRPWLQNLLKKMQKKVGFAFPLIKGRGWFNYNFGPLPHRRQIIVVVGEPLFVPKIEKPTKKDIEEWHAKYVERLTALYRDNKEIYDVECEGEMQLKS